MTAILDGEDRPARLSRGLARGQRPHQFILPRLPRRIEPGRPSTAGAGTRAEGFVRMSVVLAIDPGPEESETAEDAQEKPVPQRYRFMLLHCKNLGLLDGPCASRSWRRRSRPICLV